MPRSPDTSHELKLTWDITPDLLGVVNHNGHIERSNPAWLVTLGWTAQELRDRPLLDFIHPDDSRRTEAVFATLSDGQPALRVDNRCRHKDGSWRQLSWTAAPYGPDIYCVARDVTMEKQQEAALKDSMDFTRLALSSVNGVGVWTYDVASDRFFCDAAIAALYGLGEVGPEGILRAGFLANVHPDDRAALRATMSGGLNKSGDLELEYRIQDPDGSIRWVLSRGHTYHDQGVPVRRTGVGIETTKQHQIEDQLRQSQKMEAIGQLTGGVAHDFNNLLTVIRSSVDLLKRPNVTEERRSRYVEAISDTVDRAAKLTAQLLAFSRRQALKPEVFDVGHSIDLILNMLHTLAGSRVQISVRVPDAPCFVCADRNQFDNAIVNLAVNARDAMNGQGQLTITLRAVEGIPAIHAHASVPGDFVAVSLSDTGTGISAADLDKIFEPFFTTKGVGQGTGLGLSQVFGFAKQSGGEVQVQSELGEGTTFTLYLPRLAGAASAPVTVAHDLPVDGSGLCVLLVEDNLEVGRFAAQSLAELGYSTVWAVDASLALVELASDSDRFDVVFSDVVMPGMNGVDFGKEVVRLYRDLPVVLTSGYSHVLSQNGTAGFELLHKPYSVEQLSRILRKVATRRRR